ncbi:diiron oxygenase [Amycolatopsis sp. PS_44_ISF1]|uniref:diiron oxygenase n=1 Tax=Amycolatopsis sp. PS_44_ISF1 TaxID=2974917 RepID=UPI0028DED792|nr:diiron oxygenase [Amycolatopsis sp. PS_44_ISF1]MDT8911794.1 diiron oxygenase [Amycolatopsis sp. PS_44_ISF1]
MSGTAINADTVRKLVDSWHGRATVRDGYRPTSEDYDLAIPDYPVSLIPFAGHPSYRTLDDERRQRITTLGWLAYNERVIRAEEDVVNPTLERLGRRVYPGPLGPDLAELARQCYIDETWHTYLHMIAARRTRLVRGVTVEPDYPKALFLRSLEVQAAAAPERWQRDLLFLLWTTVGEVTVNALLGLLAHDRTIQPQHALVARLHARDESAHGAALTELAKDVHSRLDRRQRDFFAARIPVALTAFCAEDLLWWEQILRRCGVAAHREIIQDTLREPGASLLVRDFGGMRRLVRELGFEDRVDFGAVSQEGHP